jgi:hypothetical protein
VRRAFIAYGAQNWDITLDATIGRRGSNAYCELPTDEHGPVVSDLNIKITARGDLHWHSGLVTFYHQGPMSVDSTMKNIEADVRILNATSLPEYALFWFTHQTEERGMMMTTNRTWKNIELTGTVDAESAPLFRGCNKIVRSTTTSVASGNSVRILPMLIKGRQTTRGLPRYFKLSAPD